MTTYDAVVIGGSVAGSTTARELGRRGLRVALVEKNRFPRPKACGELLQPRGLAALRSSGLEPPGTRVRRLRFVSPSGASVESDFPGGDGLVVRRAIFDDFLFRAAAETPGVDAFQEQAYDIHRFRTRWVIGADGLHSQFHDRPEFRATYPRLRRAGLSTHVRGLRAELDCVEVIAHEGGELYLAPSERDEVLVACLFGHESVPPGASGEDRVRHVVQSVDVLRGRRGTLDFTTPVLGASPLGLRVDSVVAGNTLLVGDAAGAPDPITADGLSLAILSAQAAAAAIANARPLDYEEERARLFDVARWVERWMLRATSNPRVANRTVSALSKHPELLRKLLEIAQGLRSRHELTLREIVRLTV
jgi:flavin-dependent dehydrogenase